MSATDTTVRELSAQDRQKLDELLGEFHRTWAPGRLDATLADLPADLPYRLAAVTGLAAVDLEMQWQAGNRLPVEAYLEKYPELGTAENVSIELVLAEFLSRERAESAPPDMTLFLARFPQQADELRRLIMLARSPRLSGSRTRPPGGTSIHTQGDEEGPTLPEQFDRYRIQKKLGHGGMGTVYLAYDTRLDRRVALKVPRFAPGSNPENLERFYREARATATITHPNLCPLYDVGEINGTPYLTMAYIEGWPLSKFIRPDKLLPQFGVATVVRIVAQAIEEAHKHGVIHRDLKPGNVMINKRGEPIVMDFGLARWINADKEDVRLTRSGAILGAPVYMSPEQVYGDVNAMGPGCDVYSLGVILYELLTGRLPFEGPTSAVLAKTLIQPPKPPSAYRPDVDPRLEAICLKAMAKKISDRYQSMAELAAALTEYIRAERQAQTLTSLGTTRAGNGEQSSSTNVGASKPRPTTGGAPSSKSGKRRREALTTTLTGSAGGTKPDLGDPTEVLGAAGEGVASPADVRLTKPAGPRLVLWLALAGAGVLAALLCVGVLGWALWPRMPVPAKTPGPAAGEGTLRIALSETPDDVEVRLNGDLIARDRLGEPLRLAPGEYRVVVQAGKFEPWGQTVRVSGGSNPPLEVTLRPKDVADARPPAPAAGERVLEARRFGAPGHKLDRVAISPDGRFALSADYDGTVRYWDLAQGAELRAIPAHKGAVRYVAFSPDGKQALSCGEDKLACLWDLETGGLVRKFERHKDKVWCAVFAPDGKHIFTSAHNDDPTARLWDAGTGELVREYKGHTKAINALAVSPDGKRLLTAGWDATLRVWDVDSAQQLHSFKAPAQNVSTVAFFPDGRRAVAGSGPKVKVYDVIDFKELRTFDDAHKGGVWFVAVSPGGRRVLSSGQDNYVCLWDAGGGKLLHKYAGHSDAIPGLAFTPDGTRFLSVSFDGTLRLWDLPRNRYDPPPLPPGRETKEAKLVQAPVQAQPRAPYVEQVAFTADGKRAVWSGDDKVVHVWDLAQNKELLKFDKHTDGVRSFALLPDGKRVLSAGYDRALRLWEIDTGKQIRQFTGSGKRLMTVAVTSDGRRAVAGGDDPVMTVWDVDTGREVKKLTGHEKAVYAVAVTPDDHEAISGGMDQTIRRWDLETGREIARWKAPDNVSTVAVSPDGRRVLSGGKDSAVNLWDRESGELLAGFHGHSGNVTCVRFSPDGRWALSGAGDKTVRLWNVATGQEVARYVASAAGIKGVAFSPDGRQALACAADSSVRLLALPEYVAPVPVGLLRTSTAPDKLDRAAVSPDGRLALTAGYDHQVRLWDTESGMELRSYDWHTGAVHYVSFSPDGRRAASASADKTAVVWDVESGNVVRRLGHNAAVWGAVFSPDGRGLLTCCEDGTAAVWDVATGDAVQTFRGHAKRVNAAAWTPDGTRVVTASLDRTARLWDVAGGKQLKQYQGHTDGVATVAVSPNGRWIATGGYDKTVRLWDVESEKCLHTFEGHTNQVWNVAFSPDGRRLLSGGSDGTVKLWDVTGRQLLWNYTDHKDGVTGVAFHPDGRRALSASMDKTLRLWGLPPAY
jgi:WD40 repeat protein/serine/threonine protein kinase